MIRQQYPAFPFRNRLEALKILFAGSRNDVAKDAVIVNGLETLIRDSERVALPHAIERAQNYLWEFISQLPITSAVAAAMDRIPAILDTVSMLLQAANPEKLHQAISLLSARAATLRQIAARAVDAQLAQSANALRVIADNFDTRIAAYRTATVEAARIAARQLQTSATTLHQIADTLTAKRQIAFARIVATLALDTRLQERVVTASAATSAATIGLEVAKLMRAVVMTMNRSAPGETRALMQGGFDQLDQIIQRRGVSFNEAWQLLTLPPGRGEATITNVNLDVIAQSSFQTLQYFERMSAAMVSGNSAGVRSAWEDIQRIVRNQGIKDLQQLVIREGLILIITTLATAGIGFAVRTTATSLNVGIRCPDSGDDFGTSSLGAVAAAW